MTVILPTRRILHFISTVILFSLIILTFYPQPVLAGPGGFGITEINLPITDDLTVDPNMVRTYGAGDFILHSRNVLPYYILLRFNASGLPASSRITYAELNLYMQANYDAREDEWLTITVGMPTFSWREDSYRPPSTPYLWGSPLTASRVTDPDVERPITWDVTNVVKAWADGEPNYGIILVPGPEASPLVGDESADFRFESKEHAEVWGGHRPKLTVYYRWFNLELFQIIASVFNPTPPSPTSAPYYMQLSLSPIPTPSSVYSEEDFVDSPTPTLSLYEQKLHPPSSTPTPLPQLYYQSPVYEAIVPTHTPAPKPQIFTKPTPIPTKVFVKPTPMPTKVFTQPTATTAPAKTTSTNPSATPTGAKNVKGVYSGEKPEEVLARLVGTIFQVGCNQSLVCSFLYQLLDNP